MVNAVYVSNRRVFMRRYPSSTDLRIAVSHKFPSAHHTIPDASIRAGSDRTFIPQTWR